MSRLGRQNPYKGFVQLSNLSNWLSQAPGWRPPASLNGKAEIEVEAEGSRTKTLLRGRRGRVAWLRRAKRHFSNGREKRAG